MPEWRCLTNHGLVLRYIARHPRAIARDLADAIGITERAARKIVADLLETEYTAKKREGRRNRYYHLCAPFPITRESSFYTSGVGRVAFPPLRHHTMAYFLGLGFAPGLAGLGLAGPKGFFCTYITSFFLGIRYRAFILVMKMLL